MLSRSKLDLLSALGMVNHPFHKKSFLASESNALVFLPPLRFCHFMFTINFSISAYLLKFDILYGFLFNFFLYSLCLFSYSYLTHTYAFTCTWIVMILKNIIIQYRNLNSCGMPFIWSLFIPVYCFSLHKDFIFTIFSISGKGIFPFSSG